MLNYIHSMDCTDWLIIGAGVMVIAWLVFLTLERRRP